MKGFGAWAARQRGHTEPVRGAGEEQLPSNVIHFVGAGRGLHHSDLAVN